VRFGTHDGSGVCTQGGCKGTTSPRMHIEVLYHNKESGGDRHKCQWNKSNKACECLCASSTKDPAKHHHWGAAKAEVSQFFAQIQSSVMKAAGGGGLHGRLGQLHCYHRGHPDLCSGRGPCGRSSRAGHQLFFFPCGYSPSEGV
jgi:hypothetical protein